MQVIDNGAIYTGTQIRISVIQISVDCFEPVYMNGDPDLPSIAVDLASNVVLSARYTVLLIIKRIIRTIDEF